MNVVNVTLSLKLLFILGDYQDTLIPQKNKGSSTIFAFLNLDGRSSSEWGKHRVKLEAHILPGLLSSRGWESARIIL
jgi:hypothetical protein